MDQSAPHTPLSTGRTPAGNRVDDQAQVRPRARTPTPPVAAWALRTRPGSNGQPPSPSTGRAHRYRVGAPWASSRLRLVRSHTPVDRLSVRVRTADRCPSVHDLHDGQSHHVEQSPHPDVPPHLASQHGRQRRLHDQRNRSRVITQTESRQVARASRRRPGPPVSPIPKHVSRQPTGRSRRSAAPYRSPRCRRTTPQASAARRRHPPTESGPSR